MGEITYNPCPQALGGRELSGFLQDKDVILTGWGQPCIKTEDLGSVKLIAHTGGTIGGIVDEKVFDTDVSVISGNQYYAESVAEGVLAYMLYALRRLGHYEQELKEGTWAWDAGTEGLLGKCVGIISYGAISSRLIPMLKLFTDKIKVYSTHENAETAKRMGFTYASLEEIFATCDIVSVHTAKKKETFHMIRKKHFDLLREGALFVNTSRGAVIDEAALAECLREKRFRALLDVYEKEPLPADSPLRSLDNVMLFPHMAGPTYDRREKITEALLEDIARFEAGEEMENRVTKEVALQMTVS